jgi:two-component system OmpR family sensor kinase
VGRRLQTRRTGIENRALLRLTLSYLVVFAIVVAGLSLVAYVFIENNYRSIVAPALDTPEGRAGFAAAMRPALYAILSCDALLLLLVGGASYALASAALRPLALAREREERFTADIAHEMRTPLGAIASVAQAAAGGDAEEAHSALATVARRAIESGALIGDLLTLARASNDDALQRSPVDLGAIVLAVCRDASAADTEPEISVDAPSTIVSADERRLVQLVRNLVDNARERARSRVTVQLRVEDGCARLCVDDDGPGVPPELAPRLFERFAKGGDSRGSGLGLAICRWVANAHGGDIRHAGGARFVVRIPVR